MDSVTGPWLGWARRGLVELWSWAAEGGGVSELCWAPGRLPPQEMVRIGTGDMRVILSQSLVLQVETRHVSLQWAHGSRFTGFRAAWEPKRNSLQAQTSGAYSDSLSNLPSSSPLARHQHQATLHFQNWIKHHIPCLDLTTEELGHEPLWAISFQLR